MRLNETETGAREKTDQASIFIGIRNEQMNCTAPRWYQTNINVKTPRLDKCLDLSEGKLIMDKKIQKIMYILIWAMAIVIIANNNALGTVNMFLLIFSGVSFIEQSRKRILGKKNISYTAAYFLITMWFSFALFGRAIFLREERISIDIKELFCYLILVLALFPITLEISRWFDRSSYKIIQPCNTEIDNLKAAVICGFIVFVIDFTFSLGFYPCTMTGDSVGHWQQAIGARELTDYSPIAFNLLLKALFSLVDFKSPYIFVVFQILLLSLVIADICFFLHRSGVCIKILAVGSSIFAFCPSTYMLLMYLSKNPLTAVLSLGLVASLAELISETNYYLEKPEWYVKTVLIIVGLYLDRENNVIIIVPLFLFTIWFLLTEKAYGRRVLFVVGGVACVLGFVQSVIYPSIEYKHVEKSHEIIRPLLAPVASAIKQDLVLPDDVIGAAERILPKEEWRERYSPYESDPITWGNPKPKYAELSLKEGLSVYFKMLKLYPDVVIRDRLDGMNLIWDITGPVWRCPTKVEGEIQYEEIKLPNNLLDNIRAVETSLLKISIDEPVLDTFIWKNGIYIYLLLITAVFLFQKNKLRLLWAILPSLFILFTFVLVIAWQMYFYIWFFPLSVTLLLIVSIVECKKSV